jgi:hypothetical protein
VQAYPTEHSGSWREGRISRGWRLTQVAWALIRADRTMLVLAVAGIVSSLSFLFLVFLVVGASSHHSSDRFGLATAIALYPCTLASVFFNVALAGAASAAFDGEHLSAREALRLAWGKRGRIALWALISVLVGTLINEIANRLPGGGRIITWLAGAAWGLATIFVVPILAMEGIGPIAAFKRSTSLVKQRWGEGISGRVAIGAWSVIGAVPLAIALVVGGALLQRHPATGGVVIALSLAGLFALFAVVAATQQVFTVALYRYAIDAPIGGFSTGDLEYPFVADRERQKRKSWILRIGVPILAIFAVLAVIGAIVGPRHHTGAQGYFHVEYSPSQAADLSVGAPVVLNRHLVGNVVATEFDGAAVKVEFHTNPVLRDIVETTPAYVDHFRGRAYLRIGGNPLRAPIRQSPSLLTPS